MDPVLATSIIGCIGAHLTIFQGTTYDTTFVNATIQDWCINAG